MKNRVLKIPRTDAYWEESSLIKNDWALMSRQYYKIEHKLDNYVKHIVYGTVVPREDGKFEANIPEIPKTPKSSYYDKPNHTLGVYESVVEAMKAVMRNNHPRTSTNYWT